MKAFCLTAVLAAGGVQAGTTELMEMEGVTLLQPDKQHLLSAVAEASGAVHISSSGGNSRRKISFASHAIPESLGYKVEGDCCGDTSSATALFQDFGVLPMAVLHGNASAICCRQQLGIALTSPQPMYSASKLITGLIFLRLVETGQLASLDVKVADIFPWWSGDVGEGKDVTVRRLLLQTDGMQTYEGGLGACAAGTILGCAKLAYETAWSEVPRTLGVLPPTPTVSGWTYSETSFYVLGAIALELTGASDYNQVFAELILPRVPAVVAGTCSWAIPSVAQAFPGGGMLCSAEDYAALMLAVARGELITAESEQELMSAGVDAFQDGSLFGLSVPGLKFKYGLGYWQEVDETTGALKVLSSLGALGSYPWLTADKSRWGVAVRLDYIADDLASDYKKMAAVLLNFGHGVDAATIREML